MFRTHTCGELRLDDAGKTVTLAGWVQRTRDLGGMTFVDLRDRYGITQLLFDSNAGYPSGEQIVVRGLNREDVIQVEGIVRERQSKNQNNPTGEIEIRDFSRIRLLNRAKLPPFTIEEETDGGEELRMKFRYLDLRRPVIRKHIELRHRMAIEVRNYLSAQHFLEVETPVLIKSTPEGARDFVVPSRMHQGEFYALPQSPQTFKQLLMVAGFDRYFQLVKCFRDEDLRADRQPEFTQIDCEMAFVERDDVLATFEGLAKHLFKRIHGLDFPDAFPRMSYDDAMRKYGSDKPDLRFGMEFVEITDIAKGYGFSAFENADLVVGIKVPGCAAWSRKQTDALVDLVRRPQIGASGIVFMGWRDAGLSSTVDKFYIQGVRERWAERFGMSQGDLLCIMAGPAERTRKQLSELRLHLGDLLGLRDPKVFKPLWVVDFPLLEWNDEARRWHAMHHPFTSPIEADIPRLETMPGEVKANAYDLVINGTEIGGGSIRIHERDLQERMFRVLGFTDEDARYKFGFLLDAFEYGAPPHGGCAFGFDRWVALFGHRTDIREFIAFPKNNAGRDTMIDAPSKIDAVQLKELGLRG